MRLVIVDPGHFHASLLLREMYPCLDPRVAVFAPLGAEVLDYLQRVWMFNSRAENPTRWEMDAHLSFDPMGEMRRRKPGDVAVFTGRNRGKIGRILEALRAGLHVLADKPWIITPDDMGNLEVALDLAERNRLVAYDIMTERYEVTSELQREFVSDAEIFGAIEPGGPDDPGVRARSIHHVMKTVAGKPLRRPAWFFDIEEYGEGLADVGTHVVDLVQWTAFAGQAIAAADIQLAGARRWPLRLDRRQLLEVTGSDFGPLDYYCNNQVHYTLRGVHVQLEILWNWEAPAGTGDLYEAAFRGTRARAEIRQGEAEGHIPELYLAPAGASMAELWAAVRAKLARLQARWPGLDAVEGERDVRIAIPPQFRVGHEAHFAQVANQFFRYVEAPGSMPEWENPNMLAKYRVSTGGVELGRRG